MGPLGRGGMGEVYRARDLRLGQDVALKVLSPALANDARRLAQFHSEVRLAREISHPNVCRADALVDRGRPGVRITLRGTIESGAGAGERITAESRAGLITFSCRIVAESFAAPLRDEIAAVPVSSTRASTSSPAR